MLVYCVSLRGLERGSDALFGKFACRLKANPGRCNSGGEGLPDAGSVGARVLDGGEQNTQGLFDRSALRHAEDPRDVG